MKLILVTITSKNMFILKTPSKVSVIISVIVETRVSKIRTTFIIILLFNFAKYVPSMHLL